MDRHTVNWKGYMPAISTPFHEDGTVDWDGWKSLLTWLVDEGMHGLVINGTTGEWFSQTTEEMEELFRVAAEVVNGDIPIIAGCTAYTPEQVVRHAGLAEKAKLDGILVAPPPYIVPTNEELVAYYQYISDHVPLPICVYNWPRGTNVDMNTELIGRLADIDKVVAIKNSTPNMNQFLASFFAVKDKIRYFGFPMNELGISMTVDHGADGTMGAGAVLGHVHPGFYNSIWDGDYKQAIKYGRQDQFLFQSWFNTDFSAKYGSPQAIVKAALNLQNLPGGYPRSPILPLTGEQELRVKETLEQVKRL
ncbi:dihydrodipicolinate synthase family protein [Ornithinibacillus gellani]|uniref:dihydrodipicolinate synthase family protein n=1 Tax=Ornithinibacillus gellani TaxID=2293253 RepID=UPI000F4A4CB3|nr:dihydrodipicolinate synthase family protein [Ornithinibacillus gellani]TQS71180.1 dihydrodipicolinate synthase family protein [Ornithinibacillus gellani]